MLKYKRITTPTLTDGAETIADMLSGGQVKTGVLFQYRPHPWLICICGYIVTLNKLWIVQVSI